MSAIFSISNISSGKFYFRDETGKAVELQPGDVVSKWTTVFGDKNNAETDSMELKTSSGSSIVLSGSQEQLFDASTVEDVDAFNAAVAAENVELALAESEKAEKEKEEEEEQSEEEEEAQQEENMRSRSQSVEVSWSI